ncbi:MAG: aminotransferase class I/II-fold pyridoxal phosphate-dependent enzyme, partial [Nitrospirota bacterium]
KRFREIADQAGALLMVDMAHIAGLVAAGLHPSPVPYADIVTTTTHKTLRGPRGGMVLCRTAHAKAIDKCLFPGIQGGPLMHIVAAKAVALKEAQSKAFRTYQQRILDNAQALAAALVARGYYIISGGTDTHLMLVDLRPKGVTGKDAEAWLNQADIVVNKNAVPFDDQPPAIASGIRLGTPTVTTRGMRPAQMKAIAELIDTVISERGDSRAIDAVRKRVKALCKAHPFY